MIISDNASEDGTQELIKERFSDLPNIFYHRNQMNIGMTPNWRNALFNHVTGEWFMIVSDDDYLIDKYYLQNAVELLNEENIVGVFANSYILYEDRQEFKKLALPYRKIESGKTIFLNRDKVKPQDFALCNIIFNTKLAKELNAFSNDYNLSCDSELFLKTCMHGNYGVIDSYVSVYRIHSINVLSSVERDFKLLVNNMDYFLEPYAYAKKKNLLTSDELSTWQKEVVYKNIRITYLQVLLFHRHKITELKDILGIRQYDLEDILNGSPAVYKIAFFIAKKSPDIMTIFLRCYKEIMRGAGSKIPRPNL